MPDAPLTWLHLNRALLSRQMLLERSGLAIDRVLEGMGGLQMQYAPAGYIGLWSRMRDFERSTLTQALEERSVIQGTLIRATIHTVSAADYWPLMAGVRRVNREWYSRAAAAAIGDTDMAAVATAIREELSGGPMRVAQLSERLVARGFPPRALQWAQTWVDIVRVPPSGTWERRRADLYGLADHWLPPEREPAEAEGIELLIRRYLGAFGPAPLRDIASWMGMTLGQIRAIAESMPLRQLSDDAGKPLLDIDGAALPDPETPAPPRFIAAWDAMLLVHGRRTGVLPEEYRSRVFSVKTPQSVNTFLLDGRVAGTWRHEDGRIDLAPFRSLSPDERDSLDAEADRLAVFHAP